MLGLGRSGKKYASIAARYLKGRFKPPDTPEWVNGKVQEHDVDDSEIVLRAESTSSEIDRVTVEGPVEEDSNDDATVMARAESILMKAVELGEAGNFTVVPAYFSISATDNCNLRCIMCPGHTGMKGPALSLDLAEAMFGSMGSNSADFGTPKSLDMTAGEPTLNPELHLIFRTFKQRFPEASISIISNATLPVKGRVKEIFELADNVAISIDGATAETYERIRRGSRFDNVIRNTRAIATLRGGNVGVIFVAMDQNIHEMPAMVKLCADLGVRELLIQAVERRQTPFLMEGDNMDFNTPPERIQRYMDEATAEAAATGVWFNPTPGMIAHGRAPAPKPAEHIEKDQVAPGDQEEAALDGIKFCNYPWFNSPRMNQGGEKMRPLAVCCHMRNASHRAGDLKGGEHDNKSIGEIFNSMQYWRVRKGLLDGTMANESCRGCQYYSSYQWTAQQLRQVEQATDRAMARLHEPLASLELLN